MRGFIGKRARSYCAVGIHIQAFIRRRLSSRRCGAMCGGRWRRGKEERWRWRRADLWRRLRGCCWSSRWTGHMSCVFDGKTIHSRIAHTAIHFAHTNTFFTPRTRSGHGHTQTDRATPHDPHGTLITPPQVSLRFCSSLTPSLPLLSVFFDRSLIDRQHIRPAILLPPSPLLRRGRK